MLIEKIRNKGRETRNKRKAQTAKSFWDKNWQEQSIKRNVKHTRIPNIPHLRQASQVKREAPNKPSAAQEAPSVRVGQFT